MKESLHLRDALHMLKNTRAYIIDNPPPYETSVEVSRNIIVANNNHTNVQMLNAPNIKLYYSFRVSRDVGGNILRATWLSRDPFGSIAKALFHSLQQNRSKLRPVKEWKTTDLLKTITRDEREMRIAYTQRTPFNKNDFTLPQQFVTRLRHCIPQPGIL